MSLSSSCRRTENANVAQEVVYWDTSAVLSALLSDIHTARARAWLARDAVHLVSTLTGAEFHACVARLRREGHLAPPLAEATVQAFEQGPWRRILTGPDPDLFWPLSCRSRLRGADLWHLALAVSLQKDLPEIVMVSFDAMLHAAAVSEGLTPQTD